MGSGAHGALSSMAFNTVKLGQIAAAHGDIQTALANYREGLAIHERLKMPREAQQIREFIAQAEAAERRPDKLDDAIAAWIASDAQDEAAAQSLLALLNTIANAVVEASRAADSPAAES